MRPFPAMRLFPAMRRLPARRPLLFLFPSKISSQGEGPGVRPPAVMEQDALRSFRQSFLYTDWYA
jgi:hypothetical protein